MKVFQIFETIFHRIPTLFCDTLEELKSIIGAPEYAARIQNLRARFAAGQNVDDEKMNLYNIVGDAVLNEGCEFKKEHIIPVKNNVIDLDHINSDDDYNTIKNCLVENAKELNLLFLQRAPRDIEGHHSLHIIFKQLQVLPGVTGEAYIQAQQNFFVEKVCTLMGSDVIRQYVDPAVKHYGRRVFLTDRNSIIYISKRFIESYKDIDPFLKGDANVVSVNGSNNTSAIVPKQAEYQGISLNKIAQQLARDRWGDSLDPGKGNRHSELLDLVNKLSIITLDEGELKAALEGIFGDHDEKDIDMACRGAQGFHAKAKSNELISAVRKLKGEGAQTVGATTTANTIPTSPSPNTANSATAQADHIQVLVSGNTIPLPNNMVAFYKTALANVPEVHRKAGLCLVQGMLQVYCSDIEVVGCDLRNKPIALNTIAVGPPSCGKSSVFSYIGNVVLDRQAKRDEKMQDDYDKWYEAKQIANSTKTLTAPPKVALRIFSNASRNGICLNLKNSGGLNSIIYTDELKSILKDQQKAYNDTQSLLCQGFDHQITRNNSAMQSAFQGSVKVSLGSVLCSQPEYVEEFFGVTDGLATRIYSEVMNQTVSLDTPKYGNWTQDQLDIINDGIDKLENYKGVVDLPQCRTMLQAWMQGYALEYKDAEDKGEPIPFTMTLLSRRASDIALRCAAIAYVLCDCKECSAVKEICKYVANSVVQNTYLLLGEQFDKADSNGQKILKNKQNFKKLSADQRILQALPDGEFTETDVEKAMKSIGNQPTANAVAVKISQLKKSGYLIKGKKKGTYKKASVTK